MKNHNMTINWNVSPVSRVYVGDTDNLESSPALARLCEAIATLVTKGRIREVRTADPGLLRPLTAGQLDTVAQAITTYNARVASAASTRDWIHDSDGGDPLEARLYTAEQLAAMDRLDTAIKNLEDKGGHIFADNKEILEFLKHVIYRTHRSVKLN